MFKKRGRPPKPLQDYRVIMNWEDGVKNIVFSKDLRECSNVKYIPKPQIGKKVQMWYMNKWYVGTIIYYSRIKSEIDDYIRTHKLTSKLRTESNMSFKKETLNLNSTDETLNQSKEIYRNMLLEDSVKDCCLEEPLLKSTQNPSNIESHHEYYRFADAYNNEATDPPLSITSRTFECNEEQCSDVDIISIKEEELSVNEQLSDDGSDCNIVLSEPFTLARPFSNVLNEVSGSSCQPSSIRSDELISKTKVVETPVTAGNSIYKMYDLKDCSVIIKDSLRSVSLENNSALEAGSSKSTSSPDISVPHSNPIAAERQLINDNQNSSALKTVNMTKTIQKNTLPYKKRSLEKNAKKIQNVKEKKVDKKVEKTANNNKRSGYFTETLSTDEFINLNLSKLIPRKKNSPLQVKQNNKIEYANKGKVLNKENKNKVTAPLLNDSEVLVSSEILGNVNVENATAKELPLNSEDKYNGRYLFFKGQLTTDEFINMNLSSLISRQKDSRLQAKQNNQNKYANKEPFVDEENRNKITTHLLNDSEVLVSNEIPGNVNVGNSTPKEPPLNNKDSTNEISSYRNEAQAILTPTIITVDTSKHSVEHNIEDTIISQAELNDCIEKHSMLNKLLIQPIPSKQAAETSNNLMKNPATLLTDSEVLVSKERRVNVQHSTPEELPSNNRDKINEICSNQNDAQPILTHKIITVDKLKQSIEHHVDDKIEQPELHGNIENHLMQNKLVLQPLPSNKIAETMNILIKNPNVANQNSSCILNNVKVNEKSMIDNNLPPAPENFSQLHQNSPDVTSSVSKLNVNIFQKSEKRHINDEKKQDNLPSDHTYYESPLKNNPELINQCMQQIQDSSIVRKVTSQPTSTDSRNKIAHIISSSSDIHVTASVTNSKTIDNYDKECISTPDTVTTVGRMSSKTYSQPKTYLQARTDRRRRRSIRSYYQPTSVAQPPVYCSLFGAASTNAIDYNNVSPFVSQSALFYNLQNVQQSPTIYYPIGSDKNMITSAIPGPVIINPVCNTGSSEVLQCGSQNQCINDLNLTPNTSHSQGVTLHPPQSYYPIGSDKNMITSAIPGPVIINPVCNTGSSEVLQCGSQNQCINDLNLTPNTSHSQGVTLHPPQSLINISNNGNIPGVYAPSNNVSTSGISQVFVNQNSMTNNVYFPPQVALSQTGMNQTNFITNQAQPTENQMLLVYNPANNQFSFQCQTVNNPTIIQPGVQDLNSFNIRETGKEQNIINSSIGNENSVNNLCQPLAGNSNAENITHMQIATNSSLEFNIEESAPVNQMLSSLTRVDTDMKNVDANINCETEAKIENTISQRNINTPGADQVKQVMVVTNSKQNNKGENIPTKDFKGSGIQPDIVKAGTYSYKPLAENNFIDNGNKNSTANVIIPSFVDQSDGATTGVKKKRFVFTKAHPSNLRNIDDSVNFNVSYSKGQMSTNKDLCEKETIEDSSKKYKSYSNNVDKSTSNPSTVSKTTSTNKPIFIDLSVSNVGDISKMNLALNKRHSSDSKTVENSIKHNVAYVLSKESTMKVSSPIINLSDDETKVNRRALSLNSANQLDTRIVGNKYIFNDNSAKIIKTTEIDSQVVCTGNQSVPAKTSDETKLEEYLDGVPPFIREVFTCDNIRDGFINSDLVFVLSLLPDIEEMTDSQKMYFQLKVIDILNEVFSDPHLLTT